MNLLMIYFIYFAVNVSDNIVWNYLTRANGENDAVVTQLNTAARGPG
jgi:hypothetical protein